MEKKLVLVTGASRGIGRAIAERFARAGYYVVLNGRKEESLGGTVRRLQEMGLACEGIPADVSDPAAVKELFGRLRQIAARENCPGVIDVLINNAGIAHIGLLQDMEPREWRRILDTNLGGVFNTCHEAIPCMLKNHRGRILNISSVWGVAGASCEAAYSASKGGVNALTRALGKELAPSGIAVNALACGAIDTEMNSQLSEEEREALCQEIPAGRMGRPEEVAEFCLKLCESSTYLTGQVITFDGGWI